MKTDFLGMTRREFIMTTGVAGAALGACSVLPDLGGGETTIKDSICGMCSPECAVKVHIKGGKAVDIDMAYRNVLETCPRWKSLLDFTYHPKRLRDPLKRVGQRGEGSFKRISWDEALDTVADKLELIRSEYGPESTIFYVSVAKEPRPYVKQFSYLYGSPNFCTESSNCSTATTLSSILNFGGDYARAMGLESATKCKLIWSSGIKQSFPGGWHPYAQARGKGIKLITVDPRRCEAAEIADIHLQLRPGTDGALALAMHNVIINEDLYDKKFIDNNSVGFEEFKKLVQDYPPDKAEKITGVPAAKIRDAAIMYATSKPASIRTSPAAVVHHSNGVQNQRAVLLLAAVTGNLDVSGGNRGESRGGRSTFVYPFDEVAGMPPGIGSDRFPVWVSRMREMQSNTIAERIESGAPYPIKGLYGVGLNLTFFPNYNRFVENIKKLDLVVVNDYFHNSGTQFADIVLPIASWFERPRFSDRGRVAKYSDPIIEPVGECRFEWSIFAELAKRLGFGSNFSDGDVDKMFNARLASIEVTVEHLRKNPEGLAGKGGGKGSKGSKGRKGSKGTSSPSNFSTPSGKVEFASSTLADNGYDPLPTYKEPAESPVSRPDLAKKYPLVLTSGARVVQYTHSQFRQLEKLRDQLPDCLAEINPADAGPRGIKSGDLIKVSSPRGEISVKAKVTEGIIVGAIHVMHHWPGDANVNILCSDENLDPISGFAPFKSQLCQVEKA